MIKISGLIKVIEDSKQINTNFRVRLFIVTDNSNTSPQDVQFQLVQDDCNKLNGFAIGTQVTVEFNIRSRLYEGKYYYTLLARDIKTI